MVRLSEKASALFLQNGLLEPNFFLTFELKSFYKGIFCRKTNKYLSCQ